MAKKRRKQPEAVPAADPATTATRKPARGAWKVMDKTSSIAAGLLAQKASTLAWRVATGKKAPKAGRHPDVGTAEAVAWAAVGGAVVEVVRVAVQRGAASYWVKSTGSLPPGMKPLGGDVTDPVVAAKEPAPTGPAPGATSSRKVSRRSRGR